MHVLFVADGDDRYGAAHALYRLVGELLKLDRSMTISVVLTKRSRMAAGFRALGCAVYPTAYQPFWHGRPMQAWKFPVKYIVYGLAYCYGRLVGIRRLERALDVREVDIIHSNSSREDLGALLALKYRKPMVWHIREFGDLDFNGYSYRRDPVRLMNAAAAELIAVSDAVRAHWLGKGLRAERLTRIYDGVEPCLPCAPDRPAARKGLRLLMMGAFLENKGQLELVEALAGLPAAVAAQISVDFVGGGNKGYIRRVRRKARQGHVEGQIRILGYRKDFYGRLKDYDCGCICSRAEGFGLVTAEYMMAGLPVIAADSGASPELVQDGTTGLLYRPGDAADLGRKIVFMMENPEKRKQMGVAARARARRCFSAADSARQVYAVYKAVLRG